MWRWAGWFRQQSVSQPNILLITSDQQHYDTLGVTNPRIRTPALDRLAHRAHLITITGRSYRAHHRPAANGKRTQDPTLEEVKTV